ncbi:putative glycosyl hydrolase [Clostridium sp. CAG:1024]|jgi:hypothetical protein|nr:putative glycosyl hydrolase [Clostridium sp. CAG:1024]
MRKIISVALLFILLFGMVSTSNAAGNITGRMYNMTGTVCWQNRPNLSHDEVTSLMSSGGYLYDEFSKSVALVSAAPYCTVDRIRVHPFDTPTYDGGDLRIDPNYESNVVGEGQRNYNKQVHAVQTLLYELGYQLSASGDMEDSVDGVVGTRTTAAITQFQRDHNLSADGLVGANTWRALCSSSSFRYGSTTW